MDRHLSHPPNCRRELYTAISTLHARSMVQNDCYTTENLPVLRTKTSLAQRFSVGKEQS